MMIGFAKLYFKKGIIWSYAEPPLLHNHVYERHEQKEARNKPKNTRINTLIPSVFCNSDLYKIAKGLGLAKPNIAMVGERIRREPWGEAEKWKENGKVWRKLQKGSITRFMEKLHGFDVGVTKAMVES